jgi:hypothetical protein
MMASGLPSKEKPIADELGFEVGQLLAGRSVEILEPEIVGLAVACGIYDPFAVGAESDRTDGEAELKLHARPFEFQEARGLVGIEGKQCKLLLGIIRLMNRHESRQFSVRRDRDAAENGMVKRFFRVPAFARNFLQDLVGIRVEHSLAVGSAGGKVIAFAGGKSCSRFILWTRRFLVTEGLGRAGRGSPEFRAWGRSRMSTLGVAAPTISPGLSA